MTRFPHVMEGGDVCVIVVSENTALLIGEKNTWLFGAVKTFGLWKKPNFGAVSRRAHGQGESVLPLQGDGIQDRDLMIHFFVPEMLCHGHS